MEAEPAETATPPAEAATGLEPACLACGTSLAGTEAIETADRKGIAKGRFTIHVCPACGGGTTTPRVAPQALGAYYESEDYGPHVSSGATSPLFRMAMEIRMRRARLFAPLRRTAPGRVLDVGCGRGDLAAALMGRGWEAAGLDPSPRACAAARERGIEASLGTIEEADLPPASFDAIVFHHSLEHVTDPVASLSAAREALRPGGLVLVGVPNFASSRRRRLADRWWLLELPRHRFHFTPDALRIAMTEAGLELVALRENAAVLGPIASLQQRLRGDFLEAGPAFLAGYAGTLLVFPFAWTANELRGGGELLNAVAVRPA